VAQAAQARRQNPAIGILAAAQDSESWEAFEVAKLQRDDILLAFRLWLTADVSFKRLTTEYGFYRVFAVIGLNSPANADVNSLLKLAAFLAEPLRELSTCAAKFVMHTVVQSAEDAHRSRPSVAAERTQQLALARLEAKTKLHQHTKAIKKGIRDWLLMERKANPDLIAKTATHKLIQLNWLRAVNDAPLGFTHVYRRLVCPILKELKKTRRRLLQFALGEQRWRQS
jgi:hypothetical protein